ncbi:MAG: M23 family metallopeptidase, partial [Candidatus Woesearchaeota archaeon]
GDRKNPVAGIYGGPERGFHRGIDIPLDDGTPISSPLDGTMVAGYLARNTGEDGYDTFKYLGKIAEIRSRRIVRNESRQQEVHNITFQFFHISDYPEAIKEEFAERQLDERNISDANRDEFREWYLWILGEQDESKIYENFHHHGLSSYLFRRLNVNEGQVIAYGGNTGLSSGDHAHIGMLVNGSYVDPEEYYETHGEREGSISEDDLQAGVEKYEAIDDKLR